MSQSKLQHTHRRLTLLFTGVVFAIVMILGVSMLGAKYLHETQGEKNDFQRASSNIIRAIENENNFLVNFMLRRDLERSESFAKLRQGIQYPERLQVSFVVLNKDKKIILENILEKPNFDELRLEKLGISYIHDDTIIQIHQIGENTIVFFKVLHYPISAFLLDLGFLFFISCIFGILFYIVGYNFVGRTLVPVAKSIQDMQEFIHNAGHELKTPLAVMRGNLQVMQAELSFDKILLQKSIKEVDKITALIEGLRELAEIGKFRKKEVLKLDEEIEKIIQEYTQILQEKNIVLHNNIKGTLNIEANRHELHMLLTNILGNAIKYTPKKGEIFMTLKKNILSIKDTGSGISQEEQGKIFTRFYQGTSARSMDGFGIGLSLVKKIADANKWEIRVKSELEKGTEFQILF